MATGEVGGNGEGEKKLTCLAFWIGHDREVEVEVKMVRVVGQVGNRCVAFLSSLLGTRLRSLDVLSVQLEAENLESR